MRYFISVSYDGSAFQGWQKQPNGPSVQEVLENAFSVFFRFPVNLTGAGRTDSGVHALGYIAHFDSVKEIDSGDRQMIIYKINAILPHSVVLHDICQVKDNAHARFDAVKRSYKYFIHTSKDPFCTNYSLFFPYEIDLDSMNRAAMLLTGTLDFTSMAKLHSDTKNNLCTVYSAVWNRSNPFVPGQIPDNRSAFNTRFVFEITANRVLRNMVRAITGTLLEIGRGKQKPEWIIEVLEKKERCAAGNSVSAHALFLTGIEYPYKLF